MEVVFPDPFTPTIKITCGDEYYVIAANNLEQAIEHLRELYSQEAITTSEASVVPEVSLNTLLSHRLFIL